MRPTRKLDTRYNRSEKYSNFWGVDPTLIIPILALTGVTLYYMGKGIAKVSGREGEDTTNKTRNILVGLGAIIAYYKLKNFRVDGNENNQQYNPNEDYSEEQSSDSGSDRVPKVDVLNV